jgi:hypothetical protein
MLCIIIIILLLNLVYQQLMKKVRFISLIILVLVGFVLVGCDFSGDELGENEV